MRKLPPIPNPNTQSPVGLAAHRPGTKARRQEERRNPSVAGMIEGDEALVIAAPVSETYGPPGSVQRLTLSPVVQDRPCGARLALPPDYPFELTRQARPALPPALAMRASAGRPA